MESISHLPPSHSAVEEDSVLTSKSERLYDYSECEQQNKMTIEKYMSQVDDCENAILLLTKERAILIEREKGKRKFSLANVPIIYEELTRRIKHKEEEKKVLQLAIEEEKLKSYQMFTQKKIEHVLVKYNSIVKDQVLKAAEPDGGSDSQSFESVREGDQHSEFDEVLSMGKRSIQKSKGSFKRKGKTKQRSAINRAKEKYLTRNLKELKKNQISPQYKCSESIAGDEKLCVSKTTRKLMDAFGDKTKERAEQIIEKELEAFFKDELNGGVDNIAPAILNGVENFMKKQQQNVLTNKDANGVDVLECPIKKEIVKQVMKIVDVLKTSTTCSNPENISKVDILNRVKDFLRAQNSVDSMRSDLKENVKVINENIRVLKGEVDKMNKFQEKYFGENTMNSIGEMKENNSDGINSIVNQVSNMKILHLTQKTLKDFVQKIDTVERSANDAVKFLEMHKLSEMAKQNQFAHQRQLFIKQWNHQQKTGRETMDEICESMRTIHKVIPLQLSMTRMFTAQQIKADGIVDERRRLIEHLIAELKHQNDVGTMLTAQEKVYEIFYRKVERDFRKITNTQLEGLKDFLFARHQDVKNHLVIWQREETKKHRTDLLQRMDEKKRLLENAERKFTFENIFKPVAEKFKQITRNEDEVFIEKWTEHFLGENEDGPDQKDVQTKKKKLRSRRLRNKNPTK